LICDICGREAPLTHDVIYGGRRGKACENCISRYKLVRIRSSKEPLRPFKRAVSLKSSGSKNNIGVRKKYVSSNVKNRDIFREDYEYIDEWWVSIRHARERLGLTQADLARELKVKLSYIKKIENGQIPPPPDIVYRLERLLGIKIIKKVEEEEYLSGEDVGEDFSLTLGDLIRFEDDE
jgi:putative transcription factor